MIQNLKGVLRSAQDDASRRFKTPLIGFIIFSLVIGSLSGAISSALFVNYLLRVPALGPNIIKIPAERAKEEPKEARPALDEETATINAVKNALPAVVSILVTKDLNKYRQTQVLPFDEEFFREFGFEFPFRFEVTPRAGEPPPPNKQQVGGGSGFIVRGDGLILTNKHVVSDKEAEYSVVMSDGKEYPANVAAADEFLDIALVKIEAKNLPVLQLGFSDNLVIGQTVIAIGNSLGQYRNTVTKGVVSGINRRVVASDAGGESEVIEEAIQTDAAINPGNSGGPLLNLAGKVIGINTAISRAGQLVGFAIPINPAKRIIESVEKFGRIVRPWLGVRYVLINKEVAKAQNLPFDYGALIVRGGRPTELAVIPGSPADKAGLVENDIILEINGKKISEADSLAKLIGQHKPGDTIKLKVHHQGEIKIVEVLLEEFKK